jgi:hypothetical protein
MLKRLVFRREFDGGDFEGLEKFDESWRDLQAFHDDPRSQRCHDKEAVEKAVRYFDEARRHVEEGSHGSPAEMDEYQSSALQSFNLKCSPLNAVTLPKDTRDQAAIPQKASFYCFCYPSVRDTVTDDMMRAAGIDTFDPFVQFLQVAPPFRATTTMHLPSPHTLPTFSGLSPSCSPPLWPEIHFARARLSVEWSILLL